MALKRKSAIFAPTDGVLSVLRRGKAWQARGADWSSPTAYDTVATVPFASSQLRYVDAALLSTGDSDISRKVRAQLPAGVTTSDYVGIGGVVYDLTKLDASGRLSWLYLSEVSKDGTAWMVSSKVTYDDLGVASGERVFTECAYRLGKLSNAMADSMRASMTISVRSIDYGGEREVAVGSKDNKFAVKTVSTDGEWATLELQQGEVQRVGG